MKKHIIKLTDEELRMVVLGLDMYSQSWQGYASRRERIPGLMRGVRPSSAEEKQIQEHCRADVLAANNIVKQAQKIRDHLARLLTPSQV